MEIYASSKGTQWGQPVHILKSNIAILTDWLINVNLDEDEGGEDESKQYFD